MLSILIANLYFTAVLGSRALLSGSLEWAPNKSLWSQS